MTDLISAWEDAFPVYVDGGIASSGPAKPNKKLVNKLGQVIADAIAEGGGGGGGGDAALTIRVNALEAIDTEDRLEALESDADVFPAYRREMIERPGDAPELFSDVFTGSPDSSVETVRTPVTVANGKVLQLLGAGILARRGMVRIEPGRKYLVRAIAQRATDTTDPLGDAIELRIAWFTNALAAVSGTPTSVLGTFAALTVASGRTQKQAIVGLAAGDDITNVAPATTVYARIYVQSYGGNGLTNIEVLEVKDVTDAIGDSIAQSLVDDAIDAVAQVQAVETQVQTLRNDAVAAAAAAASDLWSRPVASISNTPDVSPTAGMRRLIGTSPTGAWSGHANQVTEYSGSAWLFTGTPLSGQNIRVGLLTYRYRSGSWEKAPYVISANDYADRTTAAVAVGEGDFIASPTIVNSPYYAEFEGAVGDDTGTNDTTAVNAAIVYAASQKRILKLDRMFYGMGFLLQSNVMIEGQGVSTGFSAITTAGAGDLVTYATPATCINTRLSDFEINGNQANLVTPSNVINGLKSANTGLVTGIPRHIAENLLIRECTGSGHILGFAPRDSFFSHFVIYKCGGNGFLDQGNDAIVTHYNIGQSLLTGWQCSATEGRRGFFKVWGTGQYGGSAVTGIQFRNAQNLECHAITSQESTGKGFDFFGQSGPMYGLKMIGLKSDGDGIVASQTGVNIDNCINSTFLIDVGKQTGLAGLVTTGVAVSAKTTGCTIDVKTDTNIVTPLDGGGIGGNVITLNGNRQAFVERVDDFLGDTLEASWDSKVGSDGSIVAPAINVQSGGVCRMVTGANAGGTMALDGVQLQGSLNWAANKKGLVLEARVAISAITNVAVFIGLTDQTSALEMPIYGSGTADGLTSDASNACGVLFDTVMTTKNWWLTGVKADVDATAQNSTVAPVAATFETWRIVFDNAGSATFYRNGTIVGTTVSNALTASTPLTPVIAAFSRGAAIRNIDIDYVKTGLLR